MDFDTDAKFVMANLQRYLQESRDKAQPAIRQRAIPEIQARLGLEEHFAKGDLRGAALGEFVQAYLDNTTRLHHPGYLAHQVGVPHPTAALGSLIDGLTNNAMAIYEMGPGAAAIEFFIINLLLSRIGWPAMPEDIRQRLTFSHGGGVLTHGGSLANLTVLLTARNHLDATVRENGTSSDMVILAPATSHYSIAKAAGIIGIGEKQVIDIGTDGCGRIRIDSLEKTFREALSKEKRIVAVVANACSTGTGVYDPIDEIADFCNHEGLWLHVDGAHGAAVLFSRKHRHLLKGLHKADSLILDAHKMLRTPTVCACLLVKNARTLDHTFEHTASYLFHQKPQPGFDFIQQTVECTKAALGLKFYMALAALGERGLEAYLDRQHALTQEAYDYIADQPDLEVPCRPESTILCLRLKAPDAVQLFVRDRLMVDGHFYISSTELQGKRFLRIVIIGPDTSMRDIRELISAMRAHACRWA